MKPLTKKQLAQQYGISYTTLLKWLESVKGIQLTKHRRILTPKELEIIYEALGNP